MLRFLRRLRETPEERALRRIREHYAAFGYDPTDVSDEDIRAGIKTDEVVAQTGITMSEASANLAHAIAVMPRLSDYL